MDEKAVDEEEREKLYKVLKMVVCDSQELDVSEHTVPFPEQEVPRWLIQNKFKTLKSIHERVERLEGMQNRSDENTKMLQKLKKDHDYTEEIYKLFRAADCILNFWPILAQSQWPIINCLGKGTWLEWLSPSKWMQWIVELCFSKPSSRPALRGWDWFKDLALPYLHVILGVPIYFLAW